jgi:hypothetical protein
VVSILKLKLPACCRFLVVSRSATREDLSSLMKMQIRHLTILSDSLLALLLLLLLAFGGGGGDGGSGCRRPSIECLLLVGANLGLLPAASL